MRADLKVCLVILLFPMILEDSSAERIKPAKVEESAKDDFITEVPQPLTRQEYGNKITIVGAGNVGTAVAFSLLTQFVTDEIVLIDVNKDKVQGEVKDLQDGSGFIKSPKIYGGTDYALSKNSRICIVTAGVNQKPNQKREALVQDNLKIFQKIIPSLIEHSPNAVILIVTNPVDIMTYITWVLAGRKNQHKIIGSGTNLDTSRLKFLISQDLQISAESVHGWVIGGHGDGSVIAWSGVNVAGVNVKKILQLDKAWASKMKGEKKGEDWFTKIQDKMVSSAYEVIDLKGATSWAVGLSVANLAYSIIHNVPNIHAVSTMVQGFHGIQDEVFMSLPCVLGENGVTHIIPQPLEEKELKELQKSASDMQKIIQSLDWGVQKEQQKDSKN